MSDTLKIAVISDLHCRHSSGKGLTDVNTYLTTDLFPTPINRNPVESLRAMIKGNITADLLLCPGDITDKCDPQGLITGWEHLSKISTSLGARKLIATVGNHDVDSHKIVNQDKNAFDLVKRLLEYPTPDPAANTLFWGSEYCIIEEDDFLVLSINSSFNHTDKESAKMSQIEQKTIDAIEKDLNDRDLKKIKIALTHHHPMIHSNMDYKDTDFLDKSDVLLSLLDRLDFAICIHGHKHDPRLEYKNSIPVFAAGSFSSTMNILDIKADNTFHLITIEKGTRQGVIESWVYSPKNGWTQKKDSYFPCFTGFGNRGNIEQIASDIAKWFNDAAKEYMNYSDLLIEFPQLKNLVPDDQIKLNDKMLSDHNIKFVPNLPNVPENIFKLYS